MRFLNRSRRISPQLEEWHDGTQAEAGEWLRSLRETGSDGTDDPPDPGEVARALGWLNTGSA